MFSFTLYDVLAKNLESNADSTALVMGDMEITYGELGDRVDTVAGWLHDKGVRRGDRVGIHIPKSFEEIVAVFAVARIGAVSVNVNTQRTIRQLCYIAEDCDCRTLITDRRRADRIAREGVSDTFKNIGVIGADAGYPGTTRFSDVDHDTSLPMTPPVGSDLASLLYTSGSTGKPKGVMISHRNLIEGTRRVAGYLKNTPEDQILGLVPMSAPWGVLQVTTMFMLGGSVVLQPMVMPSEIVKTLIAKQITGMAAFPETWIQMVPYLQELKPEKLFLRYITSSGGKIPQPILEAMPEVFAGVEIVLTYGLTEAFRSTYLPPELFNEKMGSLGRPCSNVDVFIVSSDGKLCGPGEQGELIHRGALVTMGYWNRPEATDEKYRPCPALKHIIGDEKVHWSGDIVRIDNDGYFWFVGRVDAMIKCSGYRISPTEVEELIYEAGLEGNAVAFGVEDNMVGQVVHVAVAFDSDTVTVEDLLRFCQRNMPSYMVPRAIHVWEGPMPRTATGKVDRVKVIEKVLSNL